MNDSIVSYQGVKFHVVPMIDVVLLLWGVGGGGGVTFVAFKIVLHFRVVLRLWKSVSYVCGGVYIGRKIGLRGHFTLVGRFTFDGVTTPDTNGLPYRSAFIEMSPFTRVYYISILCMSSVPWHVGHTLVKHFHVMGQASVARG